MTSSLPPPPPPATTRPRDPTRGGEAVGRYVCTSYLLVRLVYSASFTFTGLYTGLAYLVSEDMLVLGSAIQLQWTQRNASSALTDVVTKRWIAERQRQANFVDSQRHACAHYVDDLTTATAVKLDDVLRSSRRERRHHDVAGQPPTSVTGVVESTLHNALAQYALTLRQFKQRYRDSLASDMSPSLSVYADYLDAVESSEWLRFARSLYNRSSESSGVDHLLFHGVGDERFQTAVLASPSSDHHSNRLNVSRRAADFASFVDIQEVDEVEMWSRQFWERYVTTRRFIAAA